MDTLLQILAGLLIILTVASLRTSLYIWLPAVVVTLLVPSYLGSLSWWLLAPAWLLTAVTAVLFAVPAVRQQLLMKPVYHLLKRAMPSMSQTEREALEAGDVWWEAELFRGRPDWSKWLNRNKPQLTSEEQAFLDNEVEELCVLLDDWHINHVERDLPAEVWQFVKDKGFFGMVIPKHYGGKGFSALAHSAVVCKLASRSGSAAVDVMVPNSLGPGELLLHYGTDEQKQYYLPRLASGEEVPCFGLTGTEAGSDASAMQDTGVVCAGEFNGEQVLGIKLNWRKRYITLAPVATLLGLAFKLSDPNHLLGTETDLGITLALIPTNTPGVKIGERHYPLAMAFMNGPTEGEDVFIPLDYVIGGQDMVGKGWRMLMQCLSIGRSISLPSLSASFSALCYRTTGAYAAIRQQFKTAIGQFEGVKEALAEIGGLTYIIEAARIHTASAVDEGVKPSLPSAILKYHATELNRVVVNHAMDIHAGRAIQLGPRNYLGHVYNAVPMSITVEGANILTRNLIIFGQGAVRCHPYVQQLMQVVTDDKGVVELDQVLTPYLGYTTSNVARSILLGLSGGLLQAVPKKAAMTKYYRRINHLSAALATVADITMLLLGGELKRKERLSARLGDVLSYLYLSSCVLKYYDEHEQSAEARLHADWALQYCLHQAQQAFKEVFRNYPNRVVGKLLKVLVFPYGLRYQRPNDKLDHMIAALVQQPTELRQQLTGLIYAGSQASDAIYRVEEAWRQQLACAEILKQLKYAQRTGRVPRNASLDEQLDMALEAKILTSEQVELLRRTEQLVADAIAVDVFSHDLSHVASEKTVKNAKRSKTEAVA